MQDKERLLSIISDETKKNIDNLTIVTPSLYASIFSKFALTHNINLDESEMFTDKFLDKKISLLTDLQDQTSKNALELSDNATKAISAIKEKDASLLSQVLKETQKLRQEIEKLKESVYKDVLTHAYNRKWLSDTHIDSATQKFKNAGTLAIIDLNYFKIINDTFGHIIGDKVLIYMANQLKEIRGGVLRYGGDEFVVIFPIETTEEDAFSQLNTLRENILHKNLKVKDAEFKLSFSFGIHKYLANEGLIDVIDLADKKMYIDKLKIKERIKGI